MFSAQSAINVEVDKKKKIARTNPYIWKLIYILSNKL